MFSGECWTWIVVVMVVPIVTVMTELYPVNVVVLLENENTDLKISYHQSLAAVKLAEVSVRQLYEKVINFTFIYTNTSCNGNDTASLAAELHCDIKIDVFIGPACYGALDALLPLAKAWNIAVITPVGSGISNPSQYQMVTKLSPYSVWSYVEALETILVRYKWCNLAIIFDESSPESVMFMNGLVSVIKNLHIFDQQSYPFTGKDYTAMKLKSLLVDASSDSRVFILACMRNESRALLLQAYHLGYATSGEYVFFIIDDLSIIPSRELWNMGQSDDKELLKAMGHVIWPYIEFERDWNTSATFSSFLVYWSANKLGYNDTGIELSPYLGGYYEAVKMYGEVLNATLANEGYPLNGIALTQRIWNNTFFGIQNQVRLNEHGYRQNNVTFGSFDIKTGRMVPRALYNYEMHKIDYISCNGFDWPYSNGVPPKNVPECGFKNNLCTGNALLSKPVMGTIYGLLGLLGVTAFIGALFVYRGWKNKRNADLWWWKIPSSDLVMTARSGFSSLYLSDSRHSMRNGSTLDTILSGDALEGNVAVWKLREVNDSNLVRIFGACFEDNLKALVREYCVKGSLQDLLGNRNIPLDAQFKSSLCRDIINGLCYIHQSPIHQHGRLNSNVCLIDNRFSVKLTDFGLPTLYSNLLLDVTSDEFKNECKWKAPEILRNGVTSTGTMEGDIYSYGMILLEIVTEDYLFATETAYMTNGEIIQKVKDGGDPPFRPAMELQVALSSMTELIESCWVENPKSRPSCQSVKRSIKEISTVLGDTGNLMENLMRRMELYANNLEKMVEEKTAELREEKKKSEELLYQILPRSVADKLKAGLTIDPEVYDEVTIYFSDVVGFTAISAVSSPMEVVDLLNDIYSCFDAIIEEFDVYKVETIGDAYMVVSGLPQRNGNLHALNIARMSIKVLAAIEEFKIRHMPTESVKIRIGLHSGSVCAGVVGSKMPRYCLFGDTVNTASRMESSGEAMMIQISPTTKELLDTFGSFHVLPRGTIEVKGKGQMFTYWLLPSKAG